MDSSIRDEIQSKLSGYLAGQIDLDEFHRWFIPATWDIDAEPTPVKRLAHRVQLLLAEFANGHRPEADLQSKLWKLIDFPSVTVMVGKAVPVVPPVSETVWVRTVIQQQSVGRLLAVAPE